MLSAEWRGVKFRFACFFTYMRYTNVCVNSKCLSIRSVGQTFLYLRCDIAAAHPDKQECRSYQNRAASGLYFFSTRKFAAQVGAHASRKPRELEQILQIAPRQIREEGEYSLDGRVRMP
jgi:hypothetical protein